MGELTQPATSENTIDSIIKTVNQLYKDIQLQDSYQNPNEGGGKEASTQEPVIRNFKSFDGGEIQETSALESPVMSPTGGGKGVTVLHKSISTPLPNLIQPVNQIRKLQATLRRLKRNLKYMKSLQVDVDTELNKQLISLKNISATSSIENELEVVTRKFSDLIRKVPVSPAKQKNKKASIEYQDGDKHKPIVCLPAIHANKEDLIKRAVYKDVLGKFKALEPYDWKICLLSLAVFPENQEVNRTMLMYWWLGEGILPDYITPEECDELADDNVKLKKGSLYDKDRREKDKPEDVAKAVLDYFTEKKLIEAVENKRKVEPNSYKMTPFVHSALVLISTEMGLFDMYRKGKKPTMKQSELRKVCLVEGSSSQKEAKAKYMPGVGNIETVFNVSERFPDYTCTWFSEQQPLGMKTLGHLTRTTYTMLRVFYLGRWERAEREIEVDSRRVMKSLRVMRKLRFLSLQGISTIKSLSHSACKLRELIILDLRDCYNLENLPFDMQKLRSLVYLDLTGCDALERIPEQLSRINNLEVLKGFVVSEDISANTCQLTALKHLKKLRKLSITVDQVGFGLHDLITDIKDFLMLEKLKVRWGSRLPRRVKKHLEGGKGLVENLVPEKVLPDSFLPDQLRKLELQRIPDSKFPDWLQPQNLISLEKLYLRSWKHLKGFGAFPKKPSECSVKVLRLTCLPKLKVDWIELTELYFPKLIFLECCKSPRVTLCPCDRDGIWRRDPYD